MEGDVISQASQPACSTKLNCPILLIGNYTSQPDLADVEGLQRSIDRIAFLQTLKISPLIGSKLIFEADYTPVWAMTCLEPVEVVHLAP